MPISIHSNFPSASAVSVDISTYLQLVFDTGVDEDTVNGGSFFVEGSDTSYFSGTSIFDTQGNPTYKGSVNGTYNFDEVGTDGTTATSIGGTTTDETYYSRVTFYPEQPLRPLTTYNVYMVGTSSNQTATDIAWQGISRRTVFDPIANAGNSGNGVLKSFGGHTSQGTHTYDVEIMGTGVSGVASYKWRRNADSYSGVIRTHSFKRALNNGVSVLFSPEGTFEIGDSYQFTVREPEMMTSIYTFSFVTGEAGTRIVPGTHTSVLSTSAPPPVHELFPGLSLGYTVPINPSCNIATDRTSFTFYFNKTLSAASINTNGIEIYVGPPDGDTSIRSATTYFATSYTVSGSTLTVNL